MNRHHVLNSSLAYEEMQATAFLLQATLRRADQSIKDLGSDSMDSSIPQIWVRSRHRSGQDRARAKGATKMSKNEQNTAVIPTLSLQILCVAIVEWMEWMEWTSKSGASSSSSPTISGGLGRTVEPYQIKNI